MSLPVQATPEWHAERVLAELRLQTGKRMDWAALPIQHIPLDRIVFPCHDLDPDHVHAVDGVTLSSGPIHLQRLVDGGMFVLDGRHRVIRAGLAGHTTIPARVHP